MDQFQEIKNINQKIIKKIVIGGSFLFVVLFGSSVFLIASQYSSDLAEKTISFEDAQKIGNWEFPDSNYSLKQATKEIIYGITLKKIEIEDEKSGNSISILHMPTGFESKYLIKILGSTPGENPDYDFLERYIDDNYDEKSIELIVLGDEEVYYSVIETEEYKIWEKKIKGLLVTLRCEDAKGSIIFLVVNSPGKYNNERAFEFIKTANCDDYVAGNSDKPRIDMDNDGIPNVIEEAIGTQIMDKDSDNDGKSDFEELKNGSNPLIKSTNDKYSEAEFKSIKEQIRKVDEQSYYKIFESKKDLESDIVADSELEKQKESMISHADTDNDGLSDIVEKFIKTDKNNSDTDSDGYSDFDEIKNGYNPSGKASGDKYSSLYYQSIKEEIRNIDEENYFEIFGVE